MQVSAAQVKQLREITGLGMMDCKKALIDANGDQEKAIEILRKQGLDAATRRQGRATTEGRIGSYVHLNDKIGVLVELRCETDFVAKSQDFQDLLKDLCLHVCANRPLALDASAVSPELVAKERAIYEGQFANRPEHVRGKIIEGKLASFYKDVCLLEQPFVKDPAITVKDRIDQTIAKLGENIAVGRFIRLQLGEEV